MSNFLLTTTSPTDTSSLLWTILPLVAIFGLMYLMLIRPQKKREKKAQEMRANVEIGDEVVTTGGIIGRVVSLREDSLMIETGSDRTKMRIARWAVQSNNTVHDTTEPAK